MQFVTYENWGLLPDKASELFNQAAKDSIFFSSPWFENLIQTVFANNQDILLACVIDGDQTLAVLPLEKRSNEHWYALTHLYSSLYTLLLAEHNQQEILQCLVEGLSRSQLTLLKLGPFAEDDRNIQMLQQAMESAGFECFRDYRFYNWFHQPRGESFKDYMDARPSRVRNTVNRKRRKLEREHQLSIRLYDDHNELEKGLADYEKVYRASWKAHEQFDDFIDGLALNLAGAGWLRLAVLYIDEKPAAAQFWFVVHGKASIFKLAYDENWKQYSPGSILISFLMEHVIDIDQVEEIDFLTGNDAYKQEWMSERRQRWGLSCVRAQKPKSRLKRLVDFLKP